MILDTNTNTILNTDRDIILNTNTYLYVFTKQAKLDYSDNVSNLLVSMMIRMVNVMMIIRRNKERHDDDIGGFNDDDVYNDNEDKADKVKNNKTIKDGDISPRLLDHNCPYGHMERFDQRD